MGNKYCISICAGFPVCTQPWVKLSQHWTENRWNRIFRISFPDKNSIKLCWFLIWTKSEQSLTVLIYCLNGIENCFKTLGWMGCYPCSSKFKAHFLKILLSFFLFHEKTALLKSKLSTAGPSTLIVMRLSSVFSSIQFLWAVFN